MTYKAKTKRITLVEFRAWLEGVEELQPDNWAPNAEQWKLIRAKIDSIGAKEGALDAPAPVAATPARTFVPKGQRGAASVPAAPVAPAMANPLLNPNFVIPDAGGGVPQGPVVPKGS